ncbi:glycosyltransferase family 2 protein [Serratia oryzae]|uniref:glycosyltransferase family 2 protein n=1 Tax=Serratia oryzae TaxID=2034155 RepID=UPI0012E2BB73|nr:glycosyltransferase family 2 protein [Serratia oryzae]
MISFSIVIPFYNGSEFIMETISSILNQDNKQRSFTFEVIIVNDGSDKENADFIYQKTKHLECISLYDKENGGLMNALNYGVAKSKGDYVIIIGQDDMLSENHLNSISDIIQEGGIDVIFNDALYYSNERATNFLVRGDKIPKISNEPYDNFINCAKWNFIVSTGICIKREVLLDKPFVEQYKNQGEWLTWLRILREHSLYFNNNTKALYRRHNANMTNDLFSRFSLNNMKYNLHVNLYFYKLSYRGSREKCIFISKLCKDIIVYLYRSFFGGGRTHKKIFSKNWGS